MIIKLNWLKLSFIISVILMTLFIVLWFVVSAISGIFISVGNEPHSETDINGLFGGFGYSIRIISDASIVLSFVFLVITIVLFLKIKSKHRIIKPTAEVIKPIKRNN